MNDKTQKYLEENSISIDLFLLVLEQYLFFSYSPHVNKVLVASNQEFYQDPKVGEMLKVLFGKKVYVYLVAATTPSEYTLIQICSSHNALASILGHYYKWVAQVISRGGMYRNTIFLSEIPIENSKEDIMTEENFQGFMKQLSKTKTNRAPSKRVVLIDAITNVRSEIYPSKYYVLKHILPKAKSERIKHISDKPYLGYYFDFIDGNHDLFTFLRIYISIMLLIK